jgi:hypothetical protein
MIGIQAKCMKPRWDRKTTEAQSFPQDSNPKTLVSGPLAGHVLLSLQWGVIVPLALTNTVLQKSAKDRAAENLGMTSS